MARWCVLFVVAYFGAHAALRLTLWHHLEGDEAEQLVLVQTLAWGYHAQPPLYTWLLWPLVQLFGVSVVPLTLLRCAVLAAVFVFAHRVGRRLCADERLAWTATLGLLLIPEVLQSAYGKWTHTMLLTALTLATVLVVLRLAASCRTRDFVLLGVCAGLGIQAKYNYAHFAAALVLAAATLPVWRRILLDRRMLLAAGIALLLAAPHLAWVADHWDEVRDGPTQYTRWMHERHAASGGVVGHALRKGVEALLRGCGFLLVPLALCLAPGFRQPARPDEFAARQLLGRTLVFAAALLVPLVLSGRLLLVRQHWLTPFIVLLPAWVLARFDPEHAPTYRLARFAAVLVVGAGGVLVYRAGVQWRYHEAGHFCAQDFLFSAQAERLRSAGWHGGLAVVDHSEAGAYLRLCFPETRVKCLEFPSHEIEAPAGRPILLSWTGPADLRVLPAVRRLAGAEGEEIASSEPVNQLEECPEHFNAVGRRVQFVLIPPARPAELP